SSGKSLTIATHGVVAHCECCTLYFWSADLPPNGEAFRRHYLTCSQSSRSSTCQRNTCCPAIRSEVACEKRWSENLRRSDDFAVVCSLQKLSAGNTSGR